MAQVFISYSRRDLSFVERLAADLKSNGFEVWYDVSGISGGASWRTEIESAIKNSQFLVVVLSPDSIASEWVDREFLFASNLGRRIIPLMYRACDLSLSYVNLNYIDVQGANYKKEFPRLLHALSLTPDASPLPVPSKIGQMPIWKNTYFVATITLLVIFLGGFSLWRQNGKPPPVEPTATQPVYRFVATMTSFRTVSPPTPTLTATFTMTPEPTATKEPGYAFVESRRKS